MRPEPKPIPLGRFDWCARNDAECDRCSVTYTRALDGKRVTCTCPNHTEQDIARVVARHTNRA